MEFETVTVAEDATLPVVDVLVVTAVDVERDAVLRQLDPLDGRKQILKMPLDGNTYFVGRLGGLPVALVMGEAGSAGRQGSALVVGDSISRWSPLAVIMVGIACGKKDGGQIMGDVLVSTQVIPYEFARLTEEGQEDRGPRPEASLQLIDRVKNLFWTWEPSIGESAGGRKPILGPLLSGDKLSNREEFITELFKRFPSAKGLEMEGAGLYGAASRRNVDWLIIKAVCDWGFSKNDEHQIAAANNAVNLLKTLLAEPGVFNGLSRFESRANAGDVSKLGQITRRMAFNEAAQEIRERHEAQLSIANEIASLLSSGTFEGSQPILPQSMEPSVQLALAKNKASIESWLNAHEDTAAKYLHGAIDPKLYRDAFASEVVEIFENRGAHSRLLESGYSCLKKVYEEVQGCQRKEPK